MTLKGRYDKIMDRVQMTDEMRARVLEKVRQADLSAPEEMDSRAALEQAVGFSVEEAEHLPFAPQEVLYTAFDSGLAQVEYRGENDQTALLRKSQGAEDNSGDFDQYPDVKTLDTAGIDVTLKGAEGQFTLALWQEDGFSYSLSLSQGQDAQGWAEILSGIR